ncbi:MAG: hypothetical protein GX638_10765 [Crenarchaeota archaeon]|nr:hypothetical protein [Thermoproteota archaeon]
MNTLTITRNKPKNRYKSKTALIVTEDDLLVDLAYHNVPPSLLIKFSERIVQPMYNGNLTAAIVDLLQKALMDQEPIHVYVTNQSQYIETQESL